MLAVMISMNYLTRLCKNAVSIPHRFSTLPLSLYFAVVQLLSCVWLLVIPWIVAHQASLSFTIPGVCSNSHPVSQWCHPTSVTPISSCPPSFPASRSFPMSRLFASGDQSIGASASVSVLPMKMQDLLPFRFTGLIFLQSKGFSSLLQHHNLKAPIHIFLCLSLNL